MNDANPHRGEVSLKLVTRASDGATVEREVTLRPTFAALVAIERETGMGLLLLAHKLRLGSIEHLPTVICEGAKAAGQTIDRDAIEAAIIESGAVPVLKAASALINHAMNGGADTKNSAAAEATTN